MVCINIIHALLWIGGLICASILCVWSYSAGFDHGDEYRKAIIDGDIEEFEEED